jgi:glycosyltransferase involved in cell wall biosynthesis
MMAPRVSIITASLNSLPALEKTVASVREQSFDDWEHVIVDGGSMDGTRDWLTSLDDSFTWVSEPDHGIADAMNKGIEMSTGEWILFLHADDTFRCSGSLEEAASRLDTDADVVSHHVEFVESHRSRRYRTRGFGWYLNFKATVPHQGAFCRRTLFDSIGKFDSAFSITMDYDFFLRAHRSGVRIEVIDAVISRMPATGISSDRQWQGLLQRFDEERQVQMKNSLGRLHRLMYSLYWPFYLMYRKLRTRINTTRAAESRAF